MWHSKLQNFQNLPLFKVFFYDVGVRCQSVYEVILLYLNLPLSNVVFWALFTSFAPAVEWDARILLGLTECTDWMENDVFRVMWLCTWYFNIYCIVFWSSVNILCKFPTFANSKPQRMMGLKRALESFCILNATMRTPAADAVSALFYADCLLSAQCAFHSNISTNYICIICY